MSDETESVEAGSETSGESADTAKADTTDTSETAQTDSSAENAGGAADQTETSSETSGESVADAEQSRTGFADKGLRAGDECICPDGRKGTVHSFDAGFVCIPNHDQSE
jgi:hypothetical protein